MNGNTRTMQSTDKVCGSSRLSDYRLVRDPSDRQPPSVLVVDDSRTNRIILQRQLQSLGYRVEQAANGLDALGCMDECSFDFVLMDCQMPEMDGYEATRCLRQREGDRAKTIVIALTANTRPGHRELCLASGMDGYLNKPVSRGDLLRVLEQWLPQR